MGFSTIPVYITATKPKPKRRKSPILEYMEYKYKKYRKNKIIDKSRIEYTTSMWPVQIGYIERKFLYPGFSSYTLRLFELFMSISFVANLIGVFPQCDTFFLLIFIYCLFFFVRYVCLFYFTGKFFCLEKPKEMKDKYLIFCHRKLIVSLFFCTLMLLTIDGGKKNYVFCQTNLHKRWIFRF